MRKYFETIVLSDIHLGTAHSKVDQLGNFLRSIDCRRLILNGDIIDEWHLQKSGLAAWKTSHTQLVKTIMKMMENHGTEIIYIRGNHDEFIDGLIPLDFGPIRFERELVGLAAAKRCDGIICGHIHQPAETWIDGIHYLNSGDWVESLSALAQDADGNWRVIEYDERECLARAESEEAVGLLNFAS